MKKQNQLLINNNFAESFFGLSDDNAGKLIKAIFTYHLHKTKTKNNDVVDYALNCIIPILDANDDSYINKCNKNKENAEKRWNANAYERMQSNANDANIIEYNRIEYNRIEKNRIEKNRIEDNIEEPIGEVITSPQGHNSKVDEDKPVKEKKSKTKFIPPSYEEVLVYAKEKNREDIAQKFYDYFTVGNWVDSKGNKVNSWKQKFLTWIDKSPIVKPKEQMSAATKAFLDKYKKGE